MKCTKIKQELFEVIKRIVSQNFLLGCPGLNKEFNIHTNSSNFQLGAVIIQDGKLILSVE